MEKGDIVILKDEQEQRNTWKLGKVIELIPDDDGLVRKVKLKIADRNLSRTGKRESEPTILERPIHRLTLLLEHDR